MAINSIPLQGDISSSCEYVQKISAVLSHDWLKTMNRDETTLGGFKQFILPNTGVLEKFNLRNHSQHVRNHRRFPPTNAQAWTQQVTTAGTLITPRVG